MVNLNLWLAINLNVDYIFTTHILIGEWFKNVI